MNFKKPRTDQTNLTEDELINGCVNNDVRFQEILYNKYSSKMMGVSLRYCNSRMEAEDVLQDSFIKIFNKINTFKKQGSLEGWIRKIVVFTALKSKDKRAYKFEPRDSSEVIISNKEASALAKLESKQILQIIEQLPQGYKTVFNLYAVEGYSHKDIGDMLNISAVTSRSQYSRAKKQIIELLKKYGVSR